MKCQAMALECSLYLSPSPLPLSPWANSSSRLFLWQNCVVVISALAIEHVPGSWSGCTNPLLLACGNEMAGAVPLTVVLDPSLIWLTSQLGGVESFAFCSLPKRAVRWTPWPI